MLQQKGNGRTKKQNQQQISNYRQRPYFIFPENVLHTRSRKALNDNSSRNKNKEASLRLKTDKERSWIHQQAKQSPSPQWQNTLKRYVSYWRHRKLEWHNARPHTAKVVSDYDEQQVEVLDWPPQSPDLNTIEQIWAIMKQTLYTQESFPSNKADLIERFLTIWDELNLDLLENLSNSISGRLEKVKNRIYWKRTERTKSVIRLRKSYKK
jgi:transposase